MKRRLAAILSADIAGYSRLIGLDEAGTFQRVKALRSEVLEPLIADYEGRIVSYAGDGALAEFPSVVRAVECALAIQRAAAEREPEAPPDRRLALRIGVNSGDIIIDSANEPCGDAINIAVRLEQIAVPGGICLSDRAYEEIVGRVGAAFAYGGEPPLKNIAYGVGVWFWPADNRSGRTPDLPLAVNPTAWGRRKGPRHPEYWPELFENVPPRDLNFTGREHVLASLHQLLMHEERPAAITQAAIHGLGGIGKTSLAAEYAHRHASEYAGIWWVPAENRTVLLASLATLAGRLEPKLAEEADQEKAIRAGFAHLARSAVPYLLVYDNVENPEVLRDLVPTAGARILTTTRWADWSGRAAELQLDVLGREAAAAFLQKRAGRTDRPGAARLAEALGCLPLALDHAGAYCRLTGLSFDAYREKTDQLIARAPKRAVSPASVGATFGLAIQKAAAECSAAEVLLGFCAYLAPERIPLDLIADEIADEEERADALMTLTAVSLVEHAEVEGGDPALALHRLVQAAMRVRLAERGEAEATTERVARRLAEAFPKDAFMETDAWPRCAALLPHVLALRGRLHAGSSPAQLGRLYNAAGGYLHRLGHYSEAEPLFREALAINEETLGREHSTTAASIGNLARLYRQSDRNAEAEPLFKEAIAIEEKILGREHHDVAMLLNNLARLYTETGRYTEAEPLFKEVLVISEKKLGREHSTTAMSIGNLARLYTDTGRYAEAEPLLREALAISEETLGREHHDVAIHLNNFANLCCEMGRYAEAEPLLKKAITINEKTLGKGHPATARRQHNFARLLLATGRNEEALQQAEAALTTHEKLLGANHRWTTESVQTCAAVLTALGRSAEALALLAHYGLPLQERSWHTDRGHAPSGSSC